MKILHISSECAPFAKTGGLADVAAALPKAQRRLGHDAIVVMPKYSLIDTQRFDLQPYFETLGVWMGVGMEWCAVYRTEQTGVPVFFIESLKYFDRWGLYHDAGFNDYDDNPRRFGFLTRAALQLCRDMGFKPDIVHAHDWQAALAPAYLKIWHWEDPWLGGAASTLTIHNVAYQGVYPVSHYEYLGLQQQNFVSGKFEDHGQINFLKGGIVYADAVNTVSPTYANETRTPATAFGLAPYLSNRGEDYRGILNGCDIDEWDPAHDPLIPARYSLADLEEPASSTSGPGWGKAICKRHLQERMGLELDPGIPLVGCISRFVTQKGLDLLAQALPGILDGMRVQFAVLGAGDKGLESFYSGLPARYPGRVGCHIGYNNELAHWIEAGADFFIMPSIFEPCGLNQMYSLRYATLPIVRATGGLEDTVVQYDESTGAGTGFKFWEPSANAIYYSVGWAVSTYFDRPQHMRQMMRRAMQQDFSWERSAKEYDLLYQRALEHKAKL